MHAVILAGGKGTRLRPYTTMIPKPLVPISEDMSILDVVLRQLAAQGFLTICLAIGTHGHLIRAFAGDGSRWGLQISYAEEVSSLGTIGPLLSVLDELPEHFLVMNGDVLTDLDFADVLAHHTKIEAPLTVATCERESFIDFGVLASRDRQIVDFQEKPTLRHEVSMGVYGLSRSTLEPYEPGQPLGFDELVVDLLAKGDYPASVPWDGYWLDIGRPEDYERAASEFEQMRARLLPAAQARKCASLGRGPVMVLGGTGFIGRQVVDACRRQLDRDVIVVARTIVSHHRAGGAIELDLAKADPAQIVAVLKQTQPAAIINCAGTTSGSPTQMFANNVHAVSHLVDAVTRYDHSPRLVHIGSAAEYGDGWVGVPINESSPPRPISLYGATKLAASTIVTEAVDSGAMSGVVLRVFNPVGPGSPSSSLAGRTVDEIRRAQRTGDVVQLGPLTGRRDFVDVRDVAEAAVQAVLATDVTGVINIAGGEDISTKTLVGHLARIAGYNGRVVVDDCGPETSPGVQWQRADITKAAETLGWTPRRGLADSLEDLWNTRSRVGGHAGVQARRVRPTTDRSAKP